MPIEQSTDTAVTNQDYGYWIAERFRMEPRPKSVLSQFINKYELNGRQTHTLQIGEWDSPGRAGSATEGVTFNTLSNATNTVRQINASEFAIVQFAQTDAVAERMGFQNCAEIMSRGSLEQKLQLVASKAQIFMGSLLESHEYELASAMKTFTRSKGTLASKLTVADVDDGHFVLFSSETLPHENAVVTVDQSGVADLIESARAIAGTAFSFNLASIIEYRPDTPRTGLRGVLNGLPVYATSPEVKQTDGGTGLYGAIMLEGSGAPEDHQTSGGVYGALGFVEKNRIQVTDEYKQRGRHLEVQMKWNGDHFARDIMGVGLHSLQRT